MMEQTYAEIFNKCSGARDGMSGSLNYSVLLDVAKSYGLTEFDELLEYANEVESLLAKNRDKAKK